MSAETSNPGPLETPDEARQRASSAASATAAPGLSGDDAHDKNTRQPPSSNEGPSTTASPALHTFSHPPPPPNGPHDKQSQLLQSQGFVAPSSYLRQRGDSRAMAAPKEPETALDRDQQRGLRSIRNFLRVRNSYDVLPMSFRLIMLDTKLLVKASLNILYQNGIVSAPLWDSRTSTFAGLLTTSDYMNVVQYYWQNPDAIKHIDSFKLDNLRDIEKSIGVAPIESISIHPSRPLFEACTRMLETRARRIPLVDVDDDTRRPTVCSVITQYRILKFIAVNVHDTQLLRKPLRQIKLGTTRSLEVCNMDTPVINVINQMVRKNISCVPILNTDEVVINVFEAVDVITLIKGNNYDDLSISVGEALLKRPADFPGIYTCSPDDRLDTIFDTLRKSRVHRFIIIDEHSRLVGVLSLSDILEYVLRHSDGDEPKL